MCSAEGYVFGVIGMTSRWDVTEGSVRPGVFSASQVLFIHPEASGRTGAVMSPLTAFP